MWAQEGITTSETLLCMYWGRGGVIWGEGKREHKRSMKKSEIGAQTKSLLMISTQKLIPEYIDIGMWGFLNFIFV